MNDELRESHMVTLKNENAIKMYDEYCAELEKVQFLSMADQCAIYDVAMMEQIKQSLYVDIKMRGATELYKNGKQQMYRMNPSIKAAKDLAKQQMWHLRNLNLITPGKKFDIEAAGDDFNHF
jgi:hypothetical protein